MYLIITASPNPEGLTAACAKASLQGIYAGGGKGEIICLNKLDLQACRTCNDGWGICREQHRCVIEDQLAFLQDKMQEAQGIVLITPVYWGQPAEKMSYLLGRLRRCETTMGEKGRFVGQRFSLIAAAGGSGNGTIGCLAEMEQWCKHVRATTIDRISVAHFNREGMLSAIEHSGFAMSSMS